MRKNSLLLVANYPSDVGYAWWLMESFWMKLAQHYHGQSPVVLAYPTIIHLSSTISNAPLLPVEQDFTGRRLREVMQQCRFIRRYGIRAIYFTDWSTWSWRYPLYRLCGVRLIVTHDHTPGLRTIPRGLKAWAKSILHRLPLFTVDGAIGATDFIRKRLVDVARMPPQKCFVAPNGLPQTRENVASVDLHRKFKIPNNRKIMIMTGRANRYKGVVFILDAIANLEEETRSGLHFLFVGDGPDLKLFQHMADKLAISKQCSFPGYRNDISAFLQDADFAIHASFGEVGYSLSVLEYMQAGLPVILSDNPSVCGITKNEETGLIFREGDLNDLSTNIQKLALDDDLCRKLGEGAKASAQNFTLEQTHQALIHAIESIDRGKVLKCQ